MDFISEYDLLTFDKIEDNKRVKSLKNLNLLDTEPEYKFDTITKLTKNIFNVPIVLISLVDEKRQWFKSCIGLNILETDRKDAFCSLTIKHDEILIIHDAEIDERVNKSFYVNNPPYIKFYAGFPIHNIDNYRIGTLCIIDTVKRNFTKKEEEQLIILAGFVDNEIKMINYINKLNEKNKLIDNEIIFKNTIMATIHHDIINELSPSISYASLLKDKYKNEHFIKKLNVSLKNTKLYADNILDICKNDLHVLQVKMEICMIRHILYHVNDAYNNIEYNVQYSGTIYCDKIKIIRVLNNLINNSNKFISQNNGKIILHIFIKSEFIHFVVEDNGKGVAENEIKNLFKFCIDKNTTNGIGLYNCKLLIELQNGKIWYERINNNTCFHFTIPHSLSPKNSNARFTPLKI